jgi:hypothetical protein
MDEHIKEKMEAAGRAFLKRYRGFAQSFLERF